MDPYHPQRPHQSVANLSKSSHEPSIQDAASNTAIKATKHREFHPPPSASILWRDEFLIHHHHHTKPPPPPKKREEKNKALFSQPASDRWMGVCQTFRSRAHTPSTRRHRRNSIKCCSIHFGLFHGSPVGGAGIRCMHVAVTHAVDDKYERLVYGFL